MKSARLTSSRVGWVALLAGIAATGCVDEKIVEVPKDIFDPPDAAAAKMLGYSDQEAGLTVCGNCHVQAQTRWSATLHAEAWEGLQDSGHASESCEGCHTVNQLGNSLTEPAGWLGIPEDRYHDVQCESCHGPGLDHVESPQKSNVPLAAMSVGLDATEGCGECHQGTHHPFVEQWELSGHANIGFQASRPGCDGCHSGNGALARFEGDTNYSEWGETFAITCAVCHDPHGKFEADSDPSDPDRPLIAGQLRFAVGGVAIEDNLCSQCHNKTSNPTPVDEEGNPYTHGLEPHSPETALLNGEAGFFFPGMEIDQGDIIATHGSEANERLCAGCHVIFTEVTDPNSGDFLFNSVGHTFSAIPCLDEQGIPNGEDCALNADVRDFESCATSGCHGSANGALSALTTAALRFQNLADQVEALLAQVPEGEIDPGDGVITTAEGAYFNMELARFGGTERPSPLLAYAGTAAHNPFLVEQLLIASITAVQDEYGVSAAPGVNLNRTMDPR